MDNNNAIFIFTKDRSQSLRNALNSIKDIGINKYIIDDSIGSINKNYNKQLSETEHNTFYIGQKECNSFFSDNYICNIDNISFLNNLGSYQWNLGYVRNFALIYSKYNNFNKVMFMDDDIEISGNDLVYDSFSLLDNCDFVGAFIKGMIDDSIIGHILNKLDIKDTDERMLSGGFLFFDPSAVEIPFVNFYNEDWIWLIFQLKTGKKSIQKGEVYQKKYNPFLNYKEKILFQEKGEIMVDALFRLYKIGNFELLTKHYFWGNILTERKNYLNFIYNISIRKNEILYAEIIKWVISNYSRFSSNLFRHSFDNFFYSIDEFMSFNMTHTSNCEYVRDIHIS